MDINDGLLDDLRKIAIRRAASSPLLNENLDKKLDIVLDRNKKLITLNEFAIKVFSWDLRQCVGQNFIVLCKRFDYSFVNEIDFDKLINDGGSDTINAEISTDDGLVYKISLQIEFRKDSSQFEISGVIIDCSVNTYSSLTLENIGGIIDSMADFVFIKNADFIYQDCNLEYAKFAGFNTPQQMIGKTDFDLIWNESDATMCRSGDLEVLNNGMPKRNSLEPLSDTNGANGKLFGCKIPLILEGKLQGILGVYQLLSNNIMDDFSLLKKINKNSLKDLILKTNKRNFLLETKLVNTTITRREAECILLLLKGRIMKDIADDLEISFKTVQNYIENIKSKLGCSKKSDMISVVIESGFLDHFRF